MLQKSTLEYNLKDDDILYFLHIPKTAGISFYNVVENYFDHKDLRPNKNDPHFDPEKKLDFPSYRFIRGHLGYGVYKSLPKKPVYITMLRNPVEQILSRFAQYTSEEYNVKFPELRSSGKSLVELIQDSHEYLHFYNPQTRFIASDIDVILELKKLAKKGEHVDRMKWMERRFQEVSSEELIKTAKQRLSEFPFFGITEKFEESMYLLYYTFGWKPMPDIPRLNVRSNRVKSQDLDKETLDAIHECTKLDAELYQYALEIFESRYAEMIKELKEKFNEPKLGKTSSKELMYEILESNYFQRNGILKIPKKTAIDFNFSQPMFGTGWFPRESRKNLNITGRWCGPDTKSIIEFPLSKDNDLRIHINIIDKMADDILESLRLDVDGHQIPLKIKSRGGRTVFEGMIPSSTLKNERVYNQFTFHVNRTVSPRDIKPPASDPRKLGLEFERIIITPIKQKNQFKKSSIEYELKEDDILYFLHIPRTAGTSLTNIIENNFDYDSIYHEVIWPKLFENLPIDFTKYKLIRGHFGYWICKLLPKKPVIITMLRNPVDQLLSLYDHQRRSFKTDPYSMLKYQDEDLCELLKDSRKLRIANHQTRHLNFDVDVKKLMKRKKSKPILDPSDLKDLRPEFPTTEGKQLINTAKKRLDEFKFVGIAEKLEESLFLLYYTFGWFPSRFVPKMNIGSQRTRLEDLPKDTISKVLNMSKLDEEVYEYGKQLFQDRYSQMVNELKEKYYEPRFAELSSRDMMYEMLEKHYYHNKTISKNKAMPSLDYDFKEKLYGFGWHDKEYVEKEGKVIRWSGPETSSIIYFPLENKSDLKIQIFISQQIVPDILESLSLEVNGHPINLNIMSKPKGKEIFEKIIPIRMGKARLEGIIPKSTIINPQKFSRLTFHVNRTDSPHSIFSESNDERKLGLAFERIKIDDVNDIIKQ